MQEGDDKRIKGWSSPKPELEHRYNNKPSTFSANPCGLRYNTIQPFTFHITEVPIGPLPKVLTFEEMTYSSEGQEGQPLKARLLEDLTLL